LAEREDDGGGVVTKAAPKTPEFGCFFTGTDIKIYSQKEGGESKVKIVSD